MQRARQVLVLSHNKPFLCSIWDATDGGPHAALEVIRDGTGSTIQAWDVNRDMITLHDRRHELLRNYVGSAAGVDAREVAEALRSVLEAFCRIAYPGDYPPGRMLGPFRAICEQRVHTADEILDQTDIDGSGLTEMPTSFITTPTRLGSRSASMMPSCLILSAGNVCLHSVAVNSRRQLHPSSPFLLPLNLAIR